MFYNYCYISLIVRCNKKNFGIASDTSENHQIQNHARWETPSSIFQSHRRPLFSPPNLFYWKASNNISPSSPSKKLLDPFAYNSALWGRQTLRPFVTNYHFVSAVFLLSMMAVTKASPTLFLTLTFVDFNYTSFSKEPVPQMWTCYKSACRKLALNFLLSKKINEFTHQFLLIKFGSKFMIAFSHFVLLNISWEESFKK